MDSSEVILRLKNIEDNQRNIQDDLDEIKIILQQISSKMIDIEKSTENMDDHIGFVNNVYDSVKSPFHSIMNMVNNMNGSSNAIESSGIYGRVKEL